MKTEPVLAASSVVAFVTAMVTLVVAFGVDLDQDQQVAILGVAAVVAPLIVIVARRWVTPTASVVEYAKDGVVLAGEANERRATDSKVRDIGGPVTPPEPYVQASPSENHPEGYAVETGADGLPDDDPRRAHDA